MNIKIIYWPKGGSVEKVANKLEGKLADKGANAICVEDIDYSTLNDADLLILGGSTVGADDWKNSTYQDAWNSFFSALKKKDISLEGKKAALFGLGNHVLYPEHFVDSLKDMAELTEETGATLVGACDKKGYDFSYSAALEGDKFLGLPLDEDTQADLTDARLEGWVADLDI